MGFFDDITDTIGGGISSGFNDVLKPGFNQFVKPVINRGAQFANSELDKFDRAQDTAINSFDKLTSAIASPTFLIIAGVVVVVILIK